MLNIIVPLDLLRFEVRTFWHLDRFNKMVREDVNVLIGLNTRGRFSIQILRLLFKNIVFVQCEYSGSVNRAKLRNRVLKQVQGKVLLCDIDVVLTPEILKHTKNALNYQSFVMFSCLYRKRFFRDIDLKNSNLRTIRKSYKHLAIPSSVIGLQYNKILFDERFVGHGYEDFDFMIRYLISKDLYEIDELDFYDETYEVPFLAKGFRKKLAMFALETLEQGLIAQHIAHSVGNRYEYKKERELNSVLFANKLIELSRNKIITKKHSTSWDSIDLDKMGSYPLNLLFL